LGIATGYLGWTPEQAWHTPIPQIFLALDWRVDWARKTNPFGSSEEPAKKEEQQVTPDKIKAAFQGYGAQKVSDEQ